VPSHEGTLTNTIELMHPSAYLSPQPKLKIEWFNRFCRAHDRKSLYFTMGAPIHQNYPFPCEGSGPSSNTRFLGSLRADHPKGTSICSAVFAQLIAECLYTLQWFTRFCLKIAHSHGGIWTPCNTWFLGPTRILNPNGNSVASAVFAGLASVTY